MNDTGIDKMGSHYPLNGLDLDYRRYSHQALGGRDVIVNRIMEDFLRPRRLKPRTYNRLAHNSHDVERIKWEDCELGRDMQVMWRLTMLFWYLREPSVKIHEQIIDLIQLHHLERDPPVHRLLLSVGHSGSNPKQSPKGWRRDMVAHLSTVFDQARSSRHRHFVFSGGSADNHQWMYNNGARYGGDPVNNFLLSLGPNNCFLVPPWATLGRIKFAYASLPGSKPSRAQQVWGALPGHGWPGWEQTEYGEVAPLRRPTTIRSQSVPAPGHWAAVRSAAKLAIWAEQGWPVVLFSPLKRFSELDKRSRRRSLSRSHIRAMFADNTPGWIVEEGEEDAATAMPDDDSRKTRPKQLSCTNCAQRSHKADRCPSFCGYCGSSEHLARACTLKTTNRCKCRPFPQFHRASHCRIRCSRRCGSSHPTGTYQHLNAMTCSYRCCMCGAKGHNGIKCAFKKCPCGGYHLTQDCRWKVECAAKGCSFYLCHLHCKECGRKKGKGSEDDAFVGRTCQACLRNGIPVSAKAP